MATKKTASAKKSKPTIAKPAKTKVTTVKAVAADSTPKAPTYKQRVGQLSNRTGMLSAHIAEFVGTFILAAVAVLSQGQPLFVGFALIAIVLTIGSLSGSHVNPLVTVGAWVTRKITGLRALGYVIAQIFGGLIAFVVVSAFVSAAPEVSSEAQMYGQQAATMFAASPIPEGKELYVFFAEMLGAAIFGLAFASTFRMRADDYAARALTIGLGLFAAVTVAGVAVSYVGGSAVVNPAIAFTLQAVTFTDSFNLWAILSYIIAPIVGGVIGFFLYDIIRSEADNTIV